MEKFFSLDAIKNQGQRSGERDIIERLKKLKESLDKEGVMVLFHLLFETHGTPEAIKNLSEALPQADVYIPEFIGWINVDEIIFRAVSQGSFSEDDVEENQFLNEIVLIKESLEDCLKQIEKSKEYREYDEDIKGLKNILKFLDQITKLKDQKVGNEIFYLLSKIENSKLINNLSPEEKTKIYILLTRRLKKILALLYFIKSGNIEVGKELKDETIDSLGKYLGYTKRRCTELKILKGQNIRVFIVDLPATDHLYLESLENDFKNTAPYPPSPEKTFEESLMNFKIWLQNKANLIYETENYILNNIAQAIENLLQSNPPKQIKVLIRLGAGHTRIGNKLIKSGFSIEGYSQKRRIYFPPIDRLLRNYILKRSLKKELERELLAKALAQFYLYSAREDDNRLFGVEYENLWVTTGRIVEKLTIEDIENIFENLKKITSGELSPLELWRSYIPELR